MNTEERIQKRIDELLKYRAHLQTEILKCDAALGELQAIINPYQGQAPEPPGGAGATSNA